MRALPTRGGIFSLSVLSPTKHGESMTDKKELPFCPNLCVGGRLIKISRLWQHKHEQQAPFLGFAHDFAQEANTPLCGNA